MKKKLTLTLNEEIIQKGKVYATAHHLSLSNLLEQFLEVQIQNKELFVEKWDKVFSKLRYKTDEQLQQIRLKHIKEKHAS